ncbi:MAG: hypothetical protein LBR82_08185 [Desulfovibrio sp.]|jgi:hypothetical protein|nr:hypothetical protein [Desulfovibrio sp.]
MKNAEPVAAIKAAGKTARKQAAEQAGARRADVAADKSPDSLPADLSHAVRHPLNRVVGAAYLALRCRPDAALRGCLENVYAAGIRLQKITGAVMELPRLNAGKLCAPGKPVYQAEIIAEIRRHLGIPEAGVDAREGASYSGGSEACETSGEAPAAAPLSETVAVVRSMVGGEAGKTWNDVLFSLGRDMREPVNTIRDMAHVAGKAACAPGLRGFIDEIVSAGGELGKLSDELAALHDAERNIRA